MRYCCNLPIGCIRVLGKGEGGKEERRRKWKDEGEKKGSFMISSPIGVYLLLLGTGIADAM